jgi:2-C-methyl-D-erythritol 4-phosphate cytidylyltransferase
VAGGERRQDSVRAGLACVPAEFDGVVLVHDAARPLVEVELIEAVVQQAAATGAALPVLPLVDTVKRVRGGRVVETLDRSELGGAQTPQGFRCAILREACAAAERSGAAFTDEAMAVEALGRPVAAIPGSRRNLKITTPDDLAWAEGVVAGILRT